MTIRSILAATLVLGGSYAFAQTCPPVAGSVCLVPSRTSAMQATTYTMPIASTTNVTTVPYSGGMIAMMPMGTCTMGTMGTSMTSMVPMGYMGTSTTGYQSVSPDTAYLANQVAALRSDVRSLQGTIQATAIEARGQALIERTDRLMAEEMAFRQAIAANPNLPNAHATSIMLTQQAQSLNRDISAFNRELALIPADQRPYIAPQLSAFTVAYWDPTMQRFASYNEQFAQTTTSYQPAFAANPWLQTWHTSFQTSLNNVNTTQQTVASTGWWTNTGTGSMVAGSVETYPYGTTMTLPQGAVVYIPAGTASMMGNMGTMGTTTTGTTGTTTTTPY